jgi:hypothetical protein
VQIQNPSPGQPHRNEWVHIPVAPFSVPNGSPAQPGKIRLAAVAASLSFLTGWDPRKGIPDFHCGGSRELLQVAVQPGCGGEYKSARGRQVRFRGFPRFKCF